MTYLNKTSLRDTGCRSRSVSQSRLKQRGFTLLEMMIAIGVAGILMMIAIPNMRDWKLEQDLGSKAESLISSLELARMTAMQRNKVVDIQSSSTSSWSDGFFICARSGFAANATNCNTGSGDEIVGQYDIEYRDSGSSSIGLVIDVGETRIQPNQNHVRFLPNGMSGVTDKENSLTSFAKFGAANINVGGDVKFTICRRIGSSYEAFRITMRTSGDIQKELVKDGGTHKLQNNPCTNAG